MRPEVVVEVLEGVDVLGERAAQPLTPEPVPATTAGAPAVRAVLDELVPGRTRTVVRDR